MLDPKEAVLMAVSCDAFDFASENFSKNCITGEWTNTLESAAKQFRCEWFQGDDIVRSKNLQHKHTYHIKINNSSARLIGWAIKNTIAVRLGVDPPCGMLDPKEAVLMAVSCDAFDFASENFSKNCITGEWTNTLESAAKQFRCEWFQGDDIVRSKNLQHKHTYHIKINNSSARLIGWAIKTMNAVRLGVDPPCGVLEAVLMAVSCDAFDFASANTSNDRITVEWTKTPKN
uniref:Major sperm protein n=1 Tax=Acrobeloides nanus TaxID=290746 RepID=A0A914D4B2_9BILA